MQRMILALFLLFVPSSMSYAGLVAEEKPGFSVTVTIDSSTVATRCLGTFAHQRNSGGATIMLPVTPSNGVVWVAHVYGVCSTMTQKRGIRLAAGQGYEFDDWEGRNLGINICCILEDGSPSVPVEINVK